MFLDEPISVAGGEERRLDLAGCKNAVVSVPTKLACRLEELLVATTLGSLSQSVCFACQVGLLSK